MRSTQEIPVLNAQQYRELRNEALANVGLPPQYSLFGQVVKGLEVVDEMQRVDTDRNDGIPAPAFDDGSPPLASVAST